MTSPNISMVSSPYPVNAVFDGMDVSEPTRRDYRYRIGLFERYIERNGLNRNSFLSYKRWLAERTDLAAATKNKYLAVARIWLKELNRQGILPADITQNVRGFVQGGKHKREGLDDSEVSRLADLLHQLPDTPAHTRLKAIVSLLTLQGLRQIEIVRLNVEDLELSRSVAQIRGKGRDDTEAVFLHPETVRSLKEYLQANQIAAGAVFTSRSNNSRNQRITTKTVRSIVKSTLSKLGIDKTTHGFRHYFVTRLITDYQGDLLEVARYTRHRSLETLQVYNDNIKHRADLPRYYKTFEGVL